jgi:preprotein translocase subunit YajC
VFQFVGLFGIVVAQESQGTNWLGFLFPLVILGGLFYVLLILPQRRRQKQSQQLQSAITVGDDVRTVGGIFGTVRAEDDETFTIDVGGGTTMRIAKRAVAERLGDDTE